MGAEVMLTKNTRCPVRTEKLPAGNFGPSGLETLVSFAFSAVEEGAENG